MGPITLFDKSFLQSLSVDESVWFDRFFLTVLSPVFLIESLADLTKRGLRSRTPPQEVSLLANKTPEMESYPCMAHDTLCLNELLGMSVAMTGQVVIAGGTRVELEGRKGVIHKRSEEAEACSRWLRQEFREVDRLIARRWRDALGALDLKSALPSIEALEAVGLRCKTLEQARDTAAKFVRELSAHDALKLLSHLLNIPPQLQGGIYFRWYQCGLKPLPEYAPYCAHVLTIEIFSLIALGCGFISPDRPSNRVDIAYLYYLPFCMLFVSSDKLHSRTASLFLRGDQEFVDGPSLKAALHEIDEHYAQLPADVLEQGVFKFATVPPAGAGKLVRELWSRHLAPHALDPKPERALDPEEEKRLMDQVAALRRAAKSGEDTVSFDPEQADALSYERAIRIQKGKWYQVPKGTKADQEYGD
jgi:hypothetical protein